MTLKMYHIIIDDSGCHLMGGSPQYDGPLAAVFYAHSREHAEVVANTWAIPYGKDPAKLDDIVATDTETPIVLPRRGLYACLVRLAATKDDTHDLNVGEHAYQVWLDARKPVTVNACSAHTAAERFIARIPPEHAGVLVGQTVLVHTLGPEGYVLIHATVRASYRVDTQTAEEYTLNREIGESLREQAALVEGLFAGPR